MEAPNYPPLIARCFEPMEVKDLEQALLLVFERSEPWHTTGACFFEFQDGGNHSFTYCDDVGNVTHCLTIYPLRRDLLTTHYAKLL